MDRGLGCPGGRLLRLSPNVTLKTQVWWLIVTGTLSAIVGFAWASAIDAAHHTAISHKQSNVLAALSTSPRPNPPESTATAVASNTPIHKY